MSQKTDWVAVLRPKISIPLVGFFSGLSQYFDLWNRGGGGSIVNAIVSAVGSAILTSGLVIFILGGIAIYRVLTQKD